MVLISFSHIENLKKNVCVTEDLGVVIIETNRIIYATVDLFNETEMGLLQVQSET